ncbi:MAG: PqqD family protein [Candidatus Omnitrophica bacterium]|nr:PqqD family protein [Candidatus Omnitrophota bacterium]MBU1523237.1 PqqD family protein [Candidatus Omnitrophota bacterium]
MQGTTVYKKNKNMVTRKIADETILLPIYRTSKEINCIYTLNKPASIVWDMIDGKTTIADIKDKVLNNGFDLTKGKEKIVGEGLAPSRDSVGEALASSRYKSNQRERERERRRRA